MGGVGSGRRHGEGERAKKQTTNQHPALDVRSLKRDGTIRPGQERVDVVAHFRKRAGATSPGPERVEVAARLGLAWTPCNYGGSRPWFLCPGAGCGRRVAILYGPTSPPLCRLCLGLAYASQSRAASED